MDGTFLIILVALLLVQVPEKHWQPRFRVARLRLPRFSLIRFRQWAQVRHQLRRDERERRVLEEERRLCREREFNLIMARCLEAELPKTEEAHYAGH